MIRVNVVITSISAERFWDVRKPIPPIQISTNINLVGMEKKPDESLEVPFVLSIGYNPSIAQLSLKGNAFVNGEKSELDKILKDYDQKKTAGTNNHAINIQRCLHRIRVSLKNTKHSAADSAATGS